MCSNLVGSTGGVESICSANKQGVVILLQEDFDEIVTLILQGAEARREKRRETGVKNVHGDICSFHNTHFYTESHMWFFERALSFLSFEEQHEALHSQVRSMHNQQQHTIIMYSVSSWHVKKR